MRPQDRTYHPDSDIEFISSLPKPEGKIGFWLGDSLIDCPIYWQNFVDYVTSDYKLNGISFRLKADYNVDYDTNVKSYRKFVEFPNEKELIYFMMRWS